MPRRLAELIDEDAERIVRAVDLDSLDGSSVLVTGASGLIGVYILASLRRWMLTKGRSSEVTAVMRSAPPPGFSDLVDGPNFRTSYGDLSNPDFVRTLPAATHVIHAAGYGQPGKFMENPAKTIQLNTSVTLDLLEKMPSNGKFLFVSSSEVYSGCAEVPHNESNIGTTDPSHPRACYIEGKRCGEAICHIFRNRGRAVTMGRLALAYGPGTRSDDQRVLNSLVRRALLEGGVALLDQGAARRTYCYVTDAVEMLLSIMLRGDSAVYNVGGRSPVSIFELAQAIGRKVGVPVSTPTEAHELSGAPMDVSLDISRYCSEFGKSEFVSFEEGLERTVAWQRQLYGSGA